METFDAIIIGAGQAGPSLAGRLTAAGMQVAIVERKYFGGTCVNTGCIPTKAMVASAYAARMAQRAVEFGVVVDHPPRVDMKAVKARKDAILMKSRIGIEQWLRGMERCTVYQGNACFIAPKQIQVDDHVLAAEKIFLNVGGRARHDVKGAASVPYLDNSSMMEVDFLPEHLVIVGGGYIGLEFGQMFRRFGSEVTIVEQHSRLLSHEDEDVSLAIRDILANEGVRVRLNAHCIELAKADRGVCVKVDCESGDREVIGSHVLLATGRRPNTDDLGLDRAGIATDEHGYIQVDDELQTNVPGVWALGDCNGRGAFTHTSYNDYEIVAANLLDHDPRLVSDRITAYNVYIDPPLGRAGMTEAQARQTGKKLLIGTRPMTKVGRAVEKGESQGFIRIIVDAESKQIVGASILGTSGDEAIHCILDLMYAKAPYTVMQRAVHIHPTVSELLPTVLGDLKEAS